MRYTLFALMTLTLNLQAVEVVEDRSGLEILTPSLQGVEIRKLRLDNELEVLLISDPGARESGAALSMEVGSWQDPDSRPGQAHIAEHMVFLGNATYPDEGGFRQYLDDHGGKANAGTADRTTFYMFKVRNEDLPEALDRFAHFFIDPLFTASALSREMHAVHQEFARDSELDLWRQHLVEKEVGNPDHPGSRFDIGNLDTLGSLGHDEITSWFESHYSSNLMHLVVTSNLPIDELQEAAVKTFTAIPNRHLSPFVVQGAQASDVTQGNLLCIVPHRAQRTLSLSWELPYDYATDVAAHPADVVSFVLGHEGEESLLAHLKSEGLAEGLATGVGRQRKPSSSHMSFTVTISLTADGLANRDRVIEEAFAAIKNLQQSGVPSYIRDEMNGMARLAYSYQTRSDVFSTVSAASRGLVEEELATYPSKQLLSERFDEEAISTLLASFTPTSCHFTLLASAEEGNFVPIQKEIFMGAAYTVVPISTESMKRWTKAFGSPVASPSPNPYLPENTSLVHKGPRSTTPFPQVTTLYSDDFGTIYSAQDSQYLVPEIAWNFRIRSEAFQMGNANSAILLDLFARAVNERLAPTAYQASMGGLSYSLKPSDDGLLLSIAGYSDKAPLLLSTIFETIRDPQTSRSAFSIYRDSLKQNYQNVAKLPPLNQALDVTKNVLYRDYTTPGERVRALKRTGYDKFVAFSEHFSGSTHIDALFFGNQTLNQAKETANLVRHFQASPYPEGKGIKREVVDLPQEEGPFYISKKIKSPGNAAILAIQEGDFSFTRRAAQQILSKGISEPFYSELRTRQQTGYVVHSWEQDIEGRLFNFFAVQSTAYEGRDLLSRFELLIEQFLGELPTTFPEERFDAVKASLLTTLHQEPANPTEMGALLTTIALKHDGDFGWYSKRIAALETLTYKEFIPLALNSLGRQNHRRVAFVVEGEGEGPRYHKLPSACKLKKMCAYTD